MRYINTYPSPCDTGTKLKNLQLPTFFSVKPESSEENKDTVKQENDKQASSSAENGDGNNQGKDQHETCLHDGGSLCSVI